MNDTSPLTVRDVVVLSLVEEGPTHGYAIEAELQRRDVRDWAELSRPQVYKSLEKLQRLGYATRASRKRAAPGPQAATIRITAAGRLALRQSLRADHWMRDRNRPRFSTWLALCAGLSPQDILDGVRRRRSFVLAELAREELTQREIARDATVTTPFPAAMVELAVENFRIEAAWLERLEETIAGAGASVSLP